MRNRRLNLLVPALVLAASSALPVRSQDKPKDPWGPEQATGAPDTPEAEDAPTAWTPLEPDAGAEWLLVRFARAVPISEIRIRESLNPGTVRRVLAVREGGSQVLLWEGTDPTERAPADFVVTSAEDVTALAVVIEMDTAAWPGWNAIDAVEMVGRDGNRQWAVEAEASSSYATVGGLLAAELAPEARIFRDEALGIRMSAPGWWIRANPALLEAPGRILRAWTRDGTTTIVVSRLEAAWRPRDLLDAIAAAMVFLGAEVQAREVHNLKGLRALGLVATGTGESGEAPRIKQHWVAVPRERDLLVFLLSTREAVFDSDEKIFERMLAAVEILGPQTPEQKTGEIAPPALPLNRR
ncbi:MAG TPA: hypothetical protein VGX68_21285 [Thermoanaerobaculia bacterium]|nr:hypothetical protein [Thermoanaerobaculia bacterium]